MSDRKSAPPPRSTSRERWTGVVRPYGPADVARLQGTLRIRHTLAEVGAAEKKSERSGPLIEEWMAEAKADR